MRTHEYEIAGDTVRVHVLQSAEDAEEFSAWINSAGTAGRLVAYDTETTGLHIYARGYRLRLAQFGDADTAWVIPVELGPEWAALAAWALRALPRITIHNAAFDLLVSDRHLGVKVEEIWARVVDTKLIAHLIDSRQHHEGGLGLSLKPLAAALVDPSAPDTQGDLTAEFNRIGLTKATGWEGIPLNNRIFELYAGLDVILLSRIVPPLRELYRQAGYGPKLFAYEHRVMKIGALIRRKGMRVDADYTRQLIGVLEAERDHYAVVAARYGVTSVNSPKQVAEALAAMGEVWTETTDSGAPAVDGDVLRRFADLDKDWERTDQREPNTLADAVLRAKRAGKWVTSYARAMLDTMDAEGRIHPDINTMGARTARWSVSNPPLQQLPSSGWSIRRCIVADDGHLIAASDFAQVELRVLAALAEADDVIEAINGGADLHGFTARLVYGLTEEMITDAELKNDKRRKLCKVISLGKAYAGGPVTLAKQTNLPVSQVKQAVDQYDRALPAFSQYQRRLTRDAQAHGMTVVTPSERVLKLDRDKSYAAIAYMCQSSARDILGAALIRIEEAGLLDYVVGVVHDELICSFPAGQAEQLIVRVGELMNMRFFGIDIASDPEVYGPSWGSGYGCPEDEDYRAA
ncbi:DNA polymerase [Kitasatospora sp. NPDC003701]